MTPQETTRLMAAAKSRAVELRHEAVAGFWSAVFAAVRRAVTLPHAA